MAVLLEKKEQLTDYYLLWYSIWNKIRGEEIT